MRKDGGGRLAKPMAAAPEMLAEMTDKDPGQYCGECIFRGNNLLLLPYSCRRARANQCHTCLDSIFPFSRVPPAPLPPGKVPGRMAKVDKAINLVNLA